MKDSRNSQELPLGAPHDANPVQEWDAPATQISAGGNTTCALTEGAHDVFCWGSNVHGQLGNGRLMSGEVPDATLTRSVACAF
jgi:alpha-tubulin suppressor-like RCC1 family protein